MKYVGFETINFVFTQTSCLVISFCILLCFYTRDGYLIVVLVHPRGEYCMLTFLQVERLQLYSKRRVTRRALGRKREIFFLENRQLRTVSSCLRHITIVLNPSLRKTVKKGEMHTYIQTVLAVIQLTAIIPFSYSFDMNELELVYEPGYLFCSLSVP